LAKLQQTEFSKIPVIFLLKKNTAIVAEVIKSNTPLAADVKTGKTDPNNRAISK